jgi:anhydro-N-acetylmuramic acid kinase
MSGTSLDGIDVVLVDFSSATPRLIAQYFQAYEQPLKDALLVLHQPSANELHQSQLIANQLARDYAAATLTLLQRADIVPAQVQAIGCHGQTIRHRPEHGYTIQLNNSALLAELTAINVIGDFRSRDIAAGGQGAPLVPAFHDQVLRHASSHRVIVNIGGIANVTDLSPHRVTAGFDCGPGNLLLDAWIKQHQGVGYDKDGAWAAGGKVIPALLARMLAEPFFAAQPPKSTGRDLFNLGWLSAQLAGNESPQDVQATLLALTATSVAEAILKYCSGAAEVYICGGGAHNGTLMQALKTALPACQIQLTDVLGIEADWMEAIAFAWLAQQTTQLKSANLPVVTGAKHPCILGAIYPK